MPFSNPIVAGATLIRDAIQSSNFLKTISGWRIGTDGSAEFNDLTARGDLTIGTLGYGSGPSQISVPRYLRMLNLWAQTRSTRYMNANVTQNGTTPTVLNDLTQVIQCNSDELFYSATDDEVYNRGEYLSFEITGTLDVTCTIPGNTFLVAELQYKLAGQTAFTTLPQQLVLNESSVAASFRLPLTRKWYVTVNVPGPFLFQLRVRCTNTNATYVINNTHSELTAVITANGFTPF